MKKFSEDVLLIEGELNSNYATELRCGPACVIIFIVVHEYVLSLGFETLLEVVSSTAALFIPHIVCLPKVASHFVDDVNGNSPGIP